MSICIVPLGGPGDGVVVGEIAYDLRGDGAQSPVSSPEESWYRGENAGYVRDILLSSRPAFRDFIRQDYVERVVREHTEQRINHRLLLWSLLCFEWWCRIFLDRQPVS